MSITYTDQWTPDGRVAKRVTSVDVAEELAYTVEHERDASRYWREQCDQARAKTAELNEQILLGDGRVVSNALAESLAREIENYRRQVHAADSHRADLARVSREFEAFKNEVRDVAIRVADEQDWCRTGLNGVLEELGLKRYTKRFRVKLVVEIDIEDDDIDDDYDARSEAARFIESELDDDDEHRVQNVEAIEAEEIDD